MTAKSRMKTNLTISKLYILRDFFLLSLFFIVLVLYNNCQLFDYSAHKGDFAMGRYEELKGMIKDAIQQNKDLQEAIKTRYCFM